MSSNQPNWVTESRFAANASTAMTQDARTLSPEEAKKLNATTSADKEKALLNTTIISSADDWQGLAGFSIRAAPLSIKTAVITSQHPTDHHNFASLSPRTTAALSDPDYFHDREGEDDVFSNPDTAELEARSDATGATSPDRATSPAMGSSLSEHRPDNSSPGATSLAGLGCPPDVDALDDRADSPAKASGVDMNLCLMLRQKPSLTSQLTSNTAVPLVSTNNDTPTPSTFRDTIDTITGVSAKTHAVSRSNSRRQVWAQEGVPSALLPAANVLPSDPLEASHVSTLFAYPPLPPTETPTSHDSPAPSAIRLVLGQSPMHSACPSAAGSPVCERRGFTWTTPSMPSTSSAQRSSSKLLIRPSSSERSKIVMPNFAGNLRTDLQQQLHAASQSSMSSQPTSPVLAGSPSQSRLLSGNLGLCVTSLPVSSSIISGHIISANPSQGSRLAHNDALPNSDHLSSATLASDTSIFERDIEHRDARHVLTKSEAVDVAIPPVLDDAVEAIIEGGEQPFEIVAPLASASPAALPLSALALSASAHSLASESPHYMDNSLFSARFSVAGGPGLKTSGVSDPPPGSIAAQIAERLAPSVVSRSTAGLGPEEVDVIAGSSSPHRTSASHPRHRATYSSGASSACSSNRSRSPGHATAMGVQQVLDGSLGMQSTTELSSSTHGASIWAARCGLFSTTANSTTPASPARQTASSSVTGVTPCVNARKSFAHSVGTALPSLPLPNPFRSDTPSVLRSHSPSASFLSEPATAPSGPISMSLDGAIIPSSEAAIHELSLDSMADAIIEAETGPASPSPILSRKIQASPTAPPSIPSFGRRDTPASITAATKKQNAVSGVSSDVVAEDEDTTLSQSFPCTRRLSFFSYANIINDTPAEVVDLGQAVQRTLEDSLKQTPTLSGASMSHAWTGCGELSSQARHGNSPLAQFSNSLRASPTLTCMGALGSQPASALASPASTLTRVREARNALASLPDSK